MGKKTKAKKVKGQNGSLPEASLKTTEDLKQELNDVNNQDKDTELKNKKKEKGEEETSSPETNKQTDDKHDTGSIVEEKKKKKRKKKNKKAVNSENTGPSEGNNNVNEMDESLNEVDPENDLSGGDNLEDNKEAGAKEETVLDGNNQGEEPKKKKKKKKNQQVGQLKTSSSDSVQSNTDSVNNMVNNEKTNKEIGGKTNENKKKKKRKLGKDQNKPVEESNEPLVKKKKGNKLGNDTCNNVNGTKDKENEESSETQEEVDIGQWSSGAFENAERQEKFIKLLGGKKEKDKKISGIQQKLFSIGMAEVDDFKDQSCGNVSMNWKQQNDYMQTMENDYEKARDFHFKRGKGFGYRKPPGEGKTNFIDVSKNKSIKFDD